MIARIKLKNWRSHLDSDLEFSKGTNALLGSIGAGKSSIMNAISFGLFGTFPDLQSRKVKLDDIIMNKPSVKDESQIDVDFTINGKKYSVMRIIERNKGTTYSEIREEGNLLDAPNTQRVTELVQKVLKIDYELFSRAIYSEQNELDYFLRLPRGERMRRIDNLLMIDRFEKARSGVVTLQNKLVERKLGKQTIIDQIDVKEMEKSLEDIDYSLKKLEETKSNLSDELKDKEKEKIRLEKEIERLESIEQELISLKNKKKSVEGGIKENEEIIKSTEKLLEGKKPRDIKTDLEKLGTHILELQEKLKNNRIMYEKLTQTIYQTDTRIKFLENEIKKLNENVKEKLELKTELINIQKKFGKNPSDILEKEKKHLEDNKESITSLSTQYDSAQESLDKVIELKEKCPVCESKITEKRREQLIENYTKKIKEIRKKLETLKKENKIKQEKVLELGRIVDDFEKYTEKTKDIKELEPQLKDSKKIHSELNKTLEKNKKELEKLRNNIYYLEKNIDDKKIQKQKLESITERLTEIQDIKSRLSDLKLDSKKIEKQILETSKKIGEKSLKEIRKTFRETISRHSGLTTRIKSLAEIIIEKKNRKKDFEDKINLVEKQKKDILILESLIKDLKIFEKALQKTQSHLRERFVDTVNYTMNEIWPNLYPYDDFTSARLHIDDRDYVLQLQPRIGDWINVEGITSGGEKSIACLVLRIAFSLALAPQLKILILDEPTTNLDRAAISVLASTLRDRISDFIEQTFLITHQLELGEAVTGRIYYLERDKTLNGPTKIRAS